MSGHVRMLVLLLTLVTLLWGGACAPEGPAPEDLGGAERLVAAVDATRLMPWVEALAAAHATDAKVDCTPFPPEEGFPACVLSRDAAVRQVHDALAALNLAVRVETLGEGPHAAHNVVAELPGTTRAGEVVLVAAHLDAFYAGANDNSSAVAALLEVARVAAGQRFARTVRFVAFDLEEYGAIGSTRYVEAGHAHDVVAALVLETMGYADAAPGSQDSPPGLPLGDVGDFLTVVANEDSRPHAQRTLLMADTLALLPLKGVVAPGRGGYFGTNPLLRSDNGLLWLRGVPALMLTDTANFRNPHYHEPTDTPDTLDPRFLAGGTRVVAGALALLAEVQP